MFQKVRLVRKRNERPGIAESREARIARSISYYESMRDDYVAFVRKRLADPTIKDAKKLSPLAITTHLEGLGHTAPKGGKLRNKIVYRLSEFVGEVTLPTVALPPQKELCALTVGDLIEVVAVKHPACGEVGIIRKISPDREGFQIEFPTGSRKPRLRVLLASQIAHQPDKRLFDDPLEMAELPLSEQSLPHNSRND